ncbi:MAG: prepilin-type N-terminal cleavage/methylation domain-containing protein [Alphaproteobacteria bacterium]|nr:prepilin-type N-terminal cleavage/methylation domain-containing protein [Alphaproteobacteria bacterium]
MERVIKLQQARVRAREAGFTLVELAIVLVIIGLIIGGVLVGQDLIKAAEIRATVAQIEGYNSAVNTFRGKYTGVPGDIRNINKFFDTATWTGMQNGDGDRSLEQCAAISDGLCDNTGFAAITGIATDTHSGEALQFWHHLSAAELVPGYYNGCAKGGTGNGSVPTAESGILDQAFPRSKLDRNGIGVFADGGSNYFQIGAAEGSAGGALYKSNPSLTPQEAFDLDGKVDDGRPGTGSVIIRGSQANDPINAVLADSDLAGDGTACGILAGGVAATNPPTTAEIRSAEYNLLNENVTCTLRFKMN